MSDNNHRLRFLSSITILSGALLLFFLAPLVAKDSPEVLAHGVWSKKSQKISGGWQIVERAGDRYLVLDDEFATRKAPDLKIVLSPRPIEELNNKNALEGALIVAPLPSVKGRQEIRLPKNATLADYRSVIIHCEKYTKLWGGADLPRE